MANSNSNGRLLSTSNSPELLEPSVEKEKFHTQDWTSLDACAAPGSGAYLIRRQKKTKQYGSLGSFRGWILDHQLTISVHLFSLLALTHFCLPGARKWTTRFFILSYYDADAKGYGRGWEDIFYVISWIVLLTGVRAAALTYLFMPLSLLAGIQKSKTRIRFSEQAWQLSYFTVSWSWGMYLMYGSSYWLDLPDLWKDFPLRYLSGSFKAYYMVQFAWWLQQIFVLNIEERRKDHWQMFTHHIVTCLLVLWSLGYYETKAGNVLFCLMDIVDLFFPAAKMLKYAGYQNACDLMFGAFIVSWFFARHVAYLMLCWSVWTDVPSTMQYGCYSSVTGELQTLSNSSDPTIGGTEVFRNILQPFLNPGGLVCYNERIRLAFLCILLSLQAITIIWFMMILRVAWRVIQGQGADDSRSDDEEEDEEGADEVVEEPISQELKGGSRVHSTASRRVGAQKPVEQVVGVDGLQTLRRKGSPQIRSRKAGHRSGNIIAEHSYVLDRIGCETKSTD